MSGMNMLRRHQYLADRKLCEKQWKSEDADHVHTCKVFARHSTAHACRCGTSRRMKEEGGRRMTDKLLRERLRIDVLRGSEIHPFEIEEITVKKGDEVTRCYTKPFSDPPVPKKEEQ